MLGPAGELPLPVFGEQEYPEDIRLQIPLPRPAPRDAAPQHHDRAAQIVDSMRTRMKEQGFTEFQTPILTASSPEGARDFLVPSRIHPGKFYALPQAPQQYKQLLMMAGFDRYFQIAPCFRDEDPRADRLPGEFYQLDLEMSFVTQEDVFAAMEPVIPGVFEEFAKGKPVTQRLAAHSLCRGDAANTAPTSRTCATRSIMQDVSEHFRGSGFKVFARMLEDPKNQVWAIPGAGRRQPRVLRPHELLGAGRGPAGARLHHLARGRRGGAGPLAKNIGPERTAAIRAQLGLKAGDAAFFVAGDPDKVLRSSPASRAPRVGEELNLIDKDRFELAWIVDFPMYEWNEDDKKVDFSHNPFSMPQGGLEALQTQDPLTIKAFQYDIVCNGYEIASGGIRNHRPDAMVKAFEIAGYGEQDVVERFGGMYRAFQYGAPPHGGMAAGVDRIVMLLCGRAEPARNRAVPDEPARRRPADGRAVARSTPKQLRELHIRLNLPQKLNELAVAIEVGASEVNGAAGDGESS